MMHAAAILPEATRHALSMSYADAFTRRLPVLIVIRLPSAVATFAFLSMPNQDDEPDVHTSRKQLKEAANA